MDNTGKNYIINMDESDEEYQPVVGEINNFSIEDCSSTDASSTCDVNPLEEYMGIFGNPFLHSIGIIMHNAESMMWTKEFILELLEEMMDDTYENMRNLE